MLPTNPTNSATTTTRGRYAFELEPIARALYDKLRGHGVHCKLAFDQDKWVVFVEALRPQAQRDAKLMAAAFELGVAAARQHPPTSAPAPSLTLPQLKFLSQCAVRPKGVEASLTYAPAVRLRALGYVVIASGRGKKTIWRATATGCALVLKAPGEQHGTQKA